MDKQRAPPVATRSVADRSPPHESTPITITVGIDLTSADTVKESIRIHGKRYLERVYTPGELAECGFDAGRLAARFAAKEAAIKALRRDDEPLPWACIGVRCDGAGRPSLELSGEAAALARARGVSQLSLSLTHEGQFAAAVVVAQIEATP